MLCFYSTFGKNGTPWSAGFLNPKNGKSKIYTLFAPDSGRSIYDIEKDIGFISRALTQELLYGRSIATSDFKLILEKFDLPLNKEQVEVYDVFAPELPPPVNGDAANKRTEKVLRAISGVKPKPWHKVAANAAVAYQDIQERGIMVAGLQKYPYWSQRTFSGRSKTSGPNIQGATKEDDISNPLFGLDAIQVHLDWQGADARIAAILSNDEALLEFSERGDPYQAIADELKLPRDTCKLELLSSINAMHDDQRIFDMFPRVRAWIQESREILNAGKPLYSILGRKFVKTDGRSDLSVFNATMQGSIAHAMQLVVRRVWQEISGALLAEIHDSLVVTTEGRSAAGLARLMSGIMLHPFENVLGNNPKFPVRISMGRRWKRWKQLAVKY